MNTILISKNGRIILKDRKVSEDPLRFLSFKIELENGFCLKSFYAMMENYTTLVKLNAFLPVFMDQCRSLVNKTISSDFADHLLFSKTIEMIGFPDNPKLDIYTSLDAVTGSQRMAFSSFPLEVLLEVPITLGKLEHVIFGDKIELFEFETDYTLFELIDCISWHISFQGVHEDCEIRR